MFSSSSGRVGHPEDAQTGTAVIQPRQMHKLQVKHLLTDPMSDKTGLSVYLKFLVFTFVRNSFFLYGLEMKP